MRRTGGGRVRTGLVTVLAALSGAGGCGPGGPDAADLTELAEVMARRAAEAGSDVRLSLGEVPEEVRTLIGETPGFEVFGSAAAGSMTRVRLHTTLPSDSARTVLARQLVEEGWEFGAGSTLCHPDGWSLLATARTPGGPLDHLVMELGPATGPPCGPGPSAADRLRVDSLVLAPPPPPATGATDLECRGVNLTGRALALSSELSADSVLALYGARLEAAGWEEAEDPTPSEAATWGRDDGAEGRLTFTLATTGIPGTLECLAATSVHSWEW